MVELALCPSPSELSQVYYRSQTRIEGHLAPSETKYKPCKTYIKQLLNPQHPGFLHPKALSSYSFDSTFASRPPRLTHSMIPCSKRTSTPRAFARGALV